MPKERAREMSVVSLALRWLSDCGAALKIFLDLSSENW